MRAITKIAAGIAAAFIIIAGVPTAFAEETPLAAQEPALVDTTLPALVSITGVPSRVAPGELFGFSATAADADGIANLTFSAKEPLRYPRFDTPVFSASELIDNGNGTWMRHFTYAIPRDVPYGSYELGTIGMTDGAGNYAASSWTAPGPTIRVEDPQHPVGELTITGKKLTNSTVAATLQAPGAAVSYYWWGSSLPHAAETSSAPSFTLPLNFHGVTAMVRATATWPDGTVRMRTASFVPAKGPIPLAQVTMGAPRVGANASPGYTSVASVLGKYTNASSAQTFQWAIDGRPVPGAAKPNYTPTAADKGKKLQLTVTTTTNLPFAEQSVTQRSPSRVIGAGVLSAPIPRVAGSKYIGSKLTASSGTWTRGTKLSYQWYRGGKAIKGATRSAYTTVPADHGKPVTVRVTGKLSGYTTRTVTSKAIKATLRILAAPGIDPYGSWEVGSRATMRNYPGQKWPSGTKIAYQWLRDGKPIKGATAKSYVIKRADRNHRIHVRVTATKPGYLPVVQTVGWVAI